MNEETGKRYDLKCDREWSLIAMGMVIGWKPVYEGILQRRSLVSATDPRQNSLP